MPAINEAFIPEMFDRVNERRGAIEAQLAVLAAAGKKLDAIKRYRELTGAGSDQAKEVVAGI
jgi:ribosomal protein L7/L12